MNEIDLLSITRLVELGYTVEKNKVFICPIRAVYQFNRTEYQVDSRHPKNSFSVLFVDPKAAAKKFLETLESIDGKRA